MFVRKLILLCLTLALLAPFAGAKTPSPAKPNKHHRVRSKKAKIKPGSRANWGSHKVKVKTPKARK
jgi:hypothetical protein